MQSLIKYFLVVLFLVQGLVANEIGKPFVQLGHSKIIASTIAPDGKSLLLSDTRGKTSLWNIKTGKEIRSFEGNFETRFLTVTSNNKYVVGSGFLHIHVWDKKTGKLLKKIRIADFIKIEGDNIIYLQSNKIRQREIKSDKKMSVINHNFISISTALSNISVSPDSRLIYVSNFKDSKSIELRDIKTGKLIQIFKDNNLYVKSPSPTSDGKYVFLTSDKTIKLWNIKTGKIVRTFEKHKRRFHSIVITPNEKYIISKDFSDTAYLWDIKTGKVIRSFKGNASDSISFFTKKSISPNEKSIFYGGCLWDIETGEKLQTFKSNVDSMNILALSPNEEFILSGRDGNSKAQLKLWDTRTGQKIENFEAPFLKYVSSIVISKDNQIALVKSQKNNQLLDMKTGKELKIFSNKKLYRQNQVLSSNAKRVFSVFRDKTIKLWDIKTGKNIRTFKGHDDSINSIAVTPNKKYLISGSNDKTIKLWDIKTGKNIRTIIGKSDIEIVSITPNGKYIVSVNIDDNVKLWEIDIVKNTPSFEFHTHRINTLDISPDSEYILIGGNKNILKLFNIKTGKKIKTLKGHKNAITSVHFIKDGKFAVSASRDGTIKRWNIQTGEEILTTVSFNDGEWVSITPQGYYSASLNGDKYLNVLTDEMTVVGVDAYKEVFYRPDIVEAVLAGKDISGMIKKNKLKDIKDIKNYLPPLVAILTPENGTQTDKEKTKISIMVKDRHPIKKLELFVNGKNVLNAKNRAIARSSSKKSIRKTYDINLVSGENKITLRAFNGFAYASETITINLDKKVTNRLLPRLFLLSIGSQDYKNLPKEDWLNYAAKDARAFAKIFHSRKGILFSEVNTKVLAKGGDMEPTSDNIEDSMEFLAQAGQNDVAILFISGHGVTTNNKYYYLPEDVKMTKNETFKKSTLIKWSDITDTLEDSPSKVLVFFDTCHSGAMFDGTKVKALDNNGMLRSLQDKGMIVFSSSRGNEYSQESSKWGHGAFTYAILQGLEKMQADLTKDNHISFKELDTYVSQKVPSITNGAQHPLTYAPDGYIDFTIWVEEK